MIIKEEIDISADIASIKKRAVGAGAVIVICGPTCTGKTGIAIKLAGILSTDIVSIDSMQVYKGMDIGTDKYDVTKYGIKQYMVDAVNPDADFTVVDFRQMCRDVIQKKFFDKKKIPVLAGGSGLYLRAVTDELGFAGSESILKHDDMIDKSNNPELYHQLVRIDPVYAAKISCNDNKRIIRALQVYKSTGKQFSSFQDTWEQRKSIYNAIFIGLTAEKDVIFSCIEKRVDSMFEKGLIDEVRGLAEKGYDKYNCLKQAVGYKEVLDYLKGPENIEECRQNIIKNTKKLVKKQLTWFKADPRINWISADNYGNISGLKDIIFAIIEKQLQSWGY
jgi:tRNA dimethylallyltransferase